MNQSSECSAVIRRLQTPPIRQSTTVRSDREHTFDVFVARIVAWWPVKTFSAGKELVRDITVERRLGGQVYETWHDGTVVVWGEVSAWDAPARFAMTWIGTPKPTEVEFSFVALGPTLTRVTVEHRGWEALSDDELERDCALPGGYRSGAYSVGWAQILAGFAALATSSEQTIGQRGTTPITDEFMGIMLARSRPYTLVLLTPTPALVRPEVDPIIWEHGRRNFELRAEGLISIVCPALDDSGLSGICLFDTTAEEAARIMDEDPGVKAGIFTYRTYPVRSLPGDCLPGEAGSSAT